MIVECRLGSSVGCGFPVVGANLAVGCIVGSTDGDDNGFTNGMEVGSQLGSGNGTVSLVGFRLGSSVGCGVP